MFDNLGNLSKLLVTGLFGWAAYDLSEATVQADIDYCGVVWEQCVTVPGCTFKYNQCEGGYCSTLCSCGSTFHWEECKCETPSCT
jgi:hypothetical protein